MASSDREYEGGTTALPIEPEVAEPPVEIVKQKKRPAATTKPAYTQDEEFAFRYRWEQEQKAAQEAQQPSQPVAQEPAASPPPRRSPIAMALENKILGPAEAVANVATRPLAGAMGLVAGTAGLALPGERGQGAQMMGQVQQQTTYQPRTSAGKAAVERLNDVLGLYGRFSKWAGESVAGTEHPLAGAITESALNFLPSMLAGGARIPLARVGERPPAAIAPAAAMRSARTGEAVSPAMRAEPTMDLSKSPDMGPDRGMPLAEVGKDPTMIDRMMEKPAARIAEEKAFNIVEDRTWSAARKEGYVVPPALIEPTMTARALERFGGRPALRQEAINRNQEVTNKIARREAGLTEKEPLDDASFAAARERMSGPYREVGSLNRTTGKLLEDLKQTRSDAKKQWRFYDKSLDPRVEKRAQRLDAQANEIENHLELWAKLYRKPGLVEELRTARRNLAKNYDVEKATNIGSGDVDARAIGRKMQSGAPMTGGLATIGKFARGFGDYVGRVKEVAEPEPHVGVGLGTAGNLHGYLFERGIPFVKGPMRSMALSKVMQREREYKPGMAVRLADVATRNPYALAVAPSLGLRAPEEEQ